MPLTMSATEVIDDLRSWLERMPLAPTRVLAREQIEVIVRDFDETMSALEEMSGVKGG